MNFELDSISQPFTRYAEVVKYKQGDYLAVFNVISQDIDFYSLSTKRKEYHISFPKTGNNAFGEVISIKFIHEGLIYVLTKKNLLVCNDKAEKIKFFSLDKIRENFSAYSIFQSQGLMVLGNKVYFPVLPEKDLTKSETYKNMPVMAFIDTEKEETGYLPIQYPPIYASQKSLLNHDAYVHSAFSPKEKKIYFSFPLSDSVYVYDVSKEKTTRIFAGSYFISTERPESSGNANADYALSNEYFSIYVLENGNIVRFYRKAMQNEKYNAASSEEKQNFILIYTTAGTLLTEMQMPKNTGVTNYFSYNGKTYFNKIENEDTWGFVSLD
jgi:hypothetical protein